MKSGYAYLIIGSGKQGLAAAYDILLHGEATRLTLADGSLAAAQSGVHRLKKLLGSRTKSIEIRPRGIDAKNRKDLMEMMPLGAKLSVIVAWAIGAFGGSWFATWLATRLSRRSIGHGAAVGIILFLATLTSLRMIPHPLWMWLFGLAAVAAGAYLGSKLGMNTPVLSRIE